MLARVLLPLLVVCVCTAGSSFRCRWLDHKFSQYSQNLLQQLDLLATNSTNSTVESEDTLVFPDHLYQQASAASAEDRVAFTVQVLREVCGLFEEDHSGASWEERRVENFLNVANKQADELSSCVSKQKKKNKKLHVYFKRLSHHVLQNHNHSAESWGVMVREVRFHVLRVDLLSSSLLPV